MTEDPVTVGRWKRAGTPRTLLGNPSRYLRRDTGCATSGGHGRRRRPGRPDGLGRPGRDRPRSDRAAGGHRSDRHLAGLAARRPRCSWPPRPPESRCRRCRTGLVGRSGADHPSPAVSPTAGLDRDDPVGADLAEPARRPWLAVTGTNGKTTTIGMVESILRAAGRHAVASGNVGLGCARRRHRRPAPRRHRRRTLQLPAALRPVGPADRRSGAQRRRGSPGLARLDGRLRRGQGPGR